MDGRPLAIKQNNYMESSRQKETMKSRSLYWRGQCYLIQNAIATQYKQTSWHGHVLRIIDHYQRESRESSEHEEKQTYLDYGSNATYDKKMFK